MRQRVFGATTVIVVLAAAHAFGAEEKPEPKAALAMPAPSIAGLGTSVIELRCPWLKTSVGSKVEVGSCEPPSCPSGWKDLGVSQSCSAHSLWCGQGCGTVGECSRYCVR